MHSVSTADTWDGPSKGSVHSARRQEASHRVNADRALAFDEKRFGELLYERLRFSKEQVSAVIEALDESMVPSSEQVKTKIFADVFLYLLLRRNGTDFSVVKMWCFHFFEEKHYLENVIISRNSIQILWVALLLACTPDRLLIASAVSTLGGTDAVDAVGVDGRFIAFAGGRRGPESESSC